MRCMVCAVCLHLAPPRLRISLGLKPLKVENAQDVQKERQAHEQDVRRKEQEAKAAELRTKIEA